MCLGFQKPLSDGEAGSQAGARGQAGSAQALRRLQAAVGVVPSLPSPRLLCPSEKKKKARSVRLSSPAGLILQVRRSRGSREAVVPGEGVPRMAEGTLVTGLRETRHPAFCNRGTHPSPGSG